MHPVLLEGWFQCLFANGLAHASSQPWPRVSGPCCSLIFLFLHFCSEHFCICETICKYPPLGSDFWWIKYQLLILTTELLEKKQLLKIRSKRQDFPKDWDEPLGRSSEPLGSRSSSKESGISRAAESRTKSSKDALKQLKQLWCHQICLKLTNIASSFSADNYWSSLSNCSFGIISGAADKGQHCHFLRSAMLALYVYTFYSATKEIEMRHFQCTELWKENTVKTSRKERVTQRKGKERQLIMRKVKKSTSETKDQ